MNNISRRHKNINGNSRRNVKGNDRSLSFSERKDRFIVATTIMATISVILYKVFDLSRKIMQQIYIKKITVFGESEIGLSYEHFFVTSIITLLIFAYIYFFIYCYYETKNLIRKEISDNDEEISNRKFELIFKDGFVYIIFSIIVQVFMLVIFSPSIESYITVISLISIIAIVFVITFKQLKNFKRYCVEVVKPVFFKCVCFAGVEVIVFLILFLVSNLSTGVAKFSFNDNIVDLRFEGSTYPKEIEFFINNNEKKSMIFELEKDFSLSYIEKYIFNENGDKKSSINSNTYYYLKKIDISKYINPGDNVIEISYSIGNEKYNIKNKVTFNGSSYEFNQNRIEFEY